MFTLVKNAPKKNGICCPRCGCELVDTSVLSDKTRKEVECLICDFASIFNLRTMKLEKNY